MRRHRARTPDDGANKPCRPEPTEDADVRAGRVLLAASRVLSEEGVYGLIRASPSTRRTALALARVNSYSYGYAVCGIVYIISVVLTTSGTVLRAAE